MDAFEAKLSKATSSNNPDLLGAIGVVFDSSGKILYNHAAGRRSLAPDSDPIDHDTTIFLGSAGRWEAPLVIQGLVEYGLLLLDAPIFNHIPELSSLPIISPSPDSSHGFTLRPRRKPITWRHMLTHSSGLASDSHPLIKAWRATNPKQHFPEDAPYIVKNLSMPLLFEPGEGWYYGESTHWMQLLFERMIGDKGPVTGQGYVNCMREAVFKELEMNDSDYWAEPRLFGRRLQCVRRSEDRGIVDAGDDALGGIICSVADMLKVLKELVSDKPKSGSRESMDGFLRPAFEDGSKALEMLRSHTEDYEKPAGVGMGERPLPVNFSLMGALAVQGQLPLSHFPEGTVTWNGMPNVVWAVNRERRRGLLFATQLLPVDDEKVVDIMMEFFRGAVDTFW